jgi:hypothetical protein
MIYKIIKSASGYEGNSLSGVDNRGESCGSKGIKGYTDLDRERDLIPARATEAFFMEFLEYEVEAQNKRDEEECVFV